MGRKKGEAQSIGRSTHTHPSTGKNLRAVPCCDPTTFPSSWETNLNLELKPGISRIYTNMYSDAACCPSQCATKRAKTNAHSLTYGEAPRTRRLGKAAKTILPRRFTALSLALHVQGRRPATPLYSVFSRSLPSHLHSLSSNGQHSYLAEPGFLSST